MSGSVCRLSVQAGDGHAVDLVLPHTPPVAALLPTIVALTGAEPGGWRLSRTDGRQLDQSISLRQNMIDDGDLLILSGDDLPPLSPRQLDVFELAATRPAPSPPDATSPIPGMMFLWAVVVTAAMACAHGGLPGGALAAVLGCAGCLVAGRQADRIDAGVALLLCCAAIPFAAAAGFLAVPSRPSAPNVLLSAVAASAVAWVVVRMRRRALVLGAATVSSAAPVALTAAIAALCPLPPEAVGAALAVLALTVLSAAPRLAMIASGLAPQVAEPQRVLGAHRILTGAVLGSSSAVTLGAVLVAAGGQHRCAPALGWLLSAAMLLRVTSYPDAIRQWSVSISGLLCATSAFIITIRVFPSAATWVCLAVLAAGFTVLYAEPPRAPMQRLLVRAQALALVLVVPTALWVADVYTLARGR